MAPCCHDEHVRAVMGATGGGRGESAPLAGDGQRQETEEKVRKLRFAIAPAVVFLMVGASPALALAPTRHPVLIGHLAKVPRASGEHLCTALNMNLCLHGNGTYNQMTIETSNLTDVTFTQVP